MKTSEEREVPGVPGATVRMDEDGEITKSGGFGMTSGAFCRFFLIWDRDEDNAFFSSGVLQEGFFDIREPETAAAKATQLGRPVEERAFLTPQEFWAPVEELAGEDATLKRMRELERMEDDDEMKELDEIMNHYDQTSSSTQTSRDFPDPQDLAPPKAHSPADLYHLMGDTGSSMVVRERPFPQAQAAAASAAAASAAEPKRISKFKAERAKQ